MWETTKSVNNRPVSFRPLLQLRITEARHECDRTGLRLEILRMLERQIQKHALVLGQAGVESSDDGGLRYPERLWIGRKCARRVAEHIARHLIKHDHCSKRGLRISQEAVMSAGDENFMQAEKTLPNARVKRRILLEPLVRRGLFEPKLQDVPNPATFRIVDDCGTLQDLRINSMCALCPKSLPRPDIGCVSNIPVIGSWLPCSVDIIPC
jgi:hypothetical protein